MNVQYDGGHAVSNRTTCPPVFAEKIQAGGIAH
jgi:hypothetical protein